MRLPLLIGLTFACACATPSAQEKLAQNEEETVVRCQLIGSLSSQAEHDARNPVLDETQTAGPTRVIWLNPPSTSIIRTVEGLVYRCDARL
jgi:hypothetical protein